jgi:hypothetical protein
MGDAGIEPVSVSPDTALPLEKQPPAETQSAARGAANLAENAPEAVDLELVIAAWPKLPNEIQKKIVHIVQTVQWDKG